MPCMATIWKENGGQVLLWSSLYINPDGDNDYIRWRGKGLLYMVQMVIQRYAKHVSDYVNQNNGVVLTLGQFCLSQDFSLYPRLEQGIVYPQICSKIVSVEFSATEMTVYNVELNQYRISREEGQYIQTIDFGLRQECVRVGRVLDLKIRNKL